MTRPRDYGRIDGKVCKAEDVDLVATQILMGKVGRAYALTGAICTTIAAAITGSLVREVLSGRGKDTGVVRLGHPSGLIWTGGRVGRVEGGW